MCWLDCKVSANQAELQELEAAEQHLKRQQASLTDRLSRLENQSALKREAAVSAVDEQIKEKEAIEAENAAARAKIAENEAMVCPALECCAPSCFVWQCMSIICLEPAESQALACVDVKCDKSNVCCMSWHGMACPVSHAVQLADAAQLLWHFLRLLDILLISPFEVEVRDEQQHD